MTILLLNGYNNYFNRIVKQEASITAYKEASTSYLEYAGVNFDMQDGILTSLVVGSESQQKLIPAVAPATEPTNEVLKFDDLGSPDYLICHENNVIKSRWFVIESVKVRGGQYKLALKRDVLTDFNSQIMNSPCFVEKGWIQDVNNPLLLNPEGMVFNQRKYGEALLRDNTNCAWLVGYLKKDMSEAQSVSYTFPDAVAGAVELDEFNWADCVTLNNIDGTSEAPLKKAVQYNEGDSTCKFRIWYGVPGNPFNVSNTRLSFSLAGNSYDSMVGMLNQDWEGLTSTAFDVDISHNAQASTINSAKKIARELFEHTFQYSNINRYFNNLIAATKYSVVQGNSLVDAAEDISKYNGQIVVKNNKVYRLTIGQGTDKSFDTYYTGEDTICNDYLSALEYTPMTGVDVERNTDNPSKKKVKITLKYKEYSIVANEIVLDETVQFTLPASVNRNDCSDALYDMFCMPISPGCLGLGEPVDGRNPMDTNTVFYIGDDSEENPQYIFVDAISEIELAIAQKLATKLGAGESAGNLYDLQILPYCPLDLNGELNNTAYGPTYGKYVIDVSGLASEYMTVITNGSNAPCGIVFYPQKANFAKNIDYQVANTSEHYEWVTIVNPVLKAQGTHDGLPLYRFAEFPYKVTDGTWEIGPNLNNTNSNLIIEDGLTEDECEYISLSVSSGLQSPALLLTSTEFPTPPEGQEYSYTFTGDFTIKVLAHWIMQDDALDKKVQNECDFYRLTSPNYNSFYEFKKTKLFNGIKSLRAICTYKPLTPYIKVNPDLNDSLYSYRDYNDNIGLMLSGDYSLPMLSDAMINYELQNRNYQAIFNRQVQNLDVNQRIAKEQQQFQGLVGAITAPVTGGLAGAATGAKAGPYGAIAGAVVGVAGGAALGGVGYAKDMEWLQQQQYEARDFAVDQFQYQLGNIQALPQSMTKSTPLSFNNKVWPILEYFTCKDEEKEVLKNKLKYNGMTIMAIGQLKDYMINSGYLKGKMIRFLDLNDDSHIANAIYEEVDKGFYEGE